MANIPNEAPKPPAIPSVGEVLNPHFDLWHGSDEPHDGEQDHISTVECTDGDCPDCK